MHNEPGKETDYRENSMYETTSVGKNSPYAGPPLVLRDTDSDASTRGPIDCIKTRSINIKQNWLGEVIHLQNVITQTFEIFFAKFATQKSLEKWIDKINEFEDVGGWRDSLDLYGIIIKNCRIIDIKAPTSEDRMQDGITRGRIDITVEQRICGDTDTAGEPLSSLEGRERKAAPPCYECTLNGTPQGIYVQGAASGEYTSSMGDAQSYAVNECEGLITTTTSSGGVAPTIGAVQTPDTRCADSTTGVIPNSTVVKDYKGLQALLRDHCPFIDDIKENFKFNYGKGENISFTHSISVKLFDSCPKGVDPTTNWEPGGPGTPGAAVIITAEGAGANDYGGDDGDAPDGVDEGASVCRPGQYNVDDALKLARRILDTNTPHFGIAFHGGVLRYLNDPRGDLPAAINDDRVVPYYSETQNLVTGEVSMTKRLTILKKRDAELKWSADYNHSLTVDASGIVTVSEKGKIRGYKKLPVLIGQPKKVSDVAYANAQLGMREVLGDDFKEARDRCVEFWEAHRRFYKNSFDGAGQPQPADDEYLDKIDLHVEHPMEKTRNFNEITRECSYSISFSTSPNIFNNFMANRTLTATKGKFGSITIKEKSQLTSYVPKGEDQKRVKADGTIEDCANSAPPHGDGIQFGGATHDRVVDNPIEIIFPADYKGDGVNTGAKARAMAFYTGLLADTIDFKAPDYIDPNTGLVCPEPLKLWSRNINWSPSGRGLTYDIEFTTDKTVSCEYPDPNGIRKTEVSTNDKLPKRMHKEHPIANNKMMVHNSFQTNLGSRTVNLNVSLERIPKHNMLLCPVLPDAALRELADRAKDEATNVFTDYEGLIADDMYVKSCKYTFDSKWKATMAVVVDYLQKE